MRINELIIENNDISEGLGSTIAKGVRGVAKGVGAVAGGAVGAWDAAKQGYRAGKAAVSGRTNPDDNDPTLATNQPAAGQGQQGPAVGSTTQQTPAGQGTAQSQQLPQGQAPTGQGSQQAAGAMKAADIVKDLDATWSKITADQGSETSSPQVQQKIRAMAKNAGMAGQVVERKKIAEFHSRFLNMTI